MAKKKLVKKSVAKKPVVKLVVKARKPRVRKVPLVSAEALERAAQDDPIVALAAERKLRLEAEERNEEAFAWVNNAIDILHNVANNLRKTEV